METKTSKVKMAHEKDDVSLEDETSSKKRSVLWFFGGFVVIVAFFILAFYMMNLIQFPFTMVVDGATGSTSQ
ncbi:MAG: hypothetical protein ABL858_04090 [Candidatus Nitrotoga sp.]